MYQLTNTDTVLRISDDAHIPADADNRDWAEYQAWLKAGNVPRPSQVLTPATQGLLPLQFFERFTDAEQLAIVTTAATVPQIRLFYDKLLASSEVRNDDQRLIVGMEVLVQVNLLTPARRDEILNWS